MSESNAGELSEGCKWPVTDPAKHGLPPELNNFNSMEMILPIVLLALMRNGATGKICLSIS